MTTQITIRTVGNRALYRSLYESIDSETHHHTIGGAIRRVQKINRNAEQWGKSVGQWGTVEIEINGEKLDAMDADWLMGGGYDRYDLESGALERAWESAVKA